MTITRDRCDDCRGPFADGETVFTYTLSGSAADLDGVDGERVFLHAPCATRVTRVMKGRNQRERMALAHKLALSVKDVVAHDNIP